MKKFTLTEDGTLLFRTDPTNPLPGKPVGRIIKGDALLQPDIDITDSGIDTGNVKEWLALHINETLPSLALLKDEEEIQEPARNIANKIYESLGILPRAELEDDIAALDETGRAALRQRKIRLGLLLVFLPLLNKPAAVRLRALLWNLWKNKELPAFVPNDGVTSISIADKDNIDPLYFRAIGYPVYGSRAIRVDMLDRLISAVYDNANKGVFQARHEMAEWLGCPIPDLYTVLEAMGHKKIHDPADDITVGTETREEPKETIISESGTSAPVAETENSPTENPPPAQTKKPELATFRLRKGNAYGKSQHRKTPEAANAPPKKLFQKPHKKKDDKPREKPERIMSAVSKKKIEDSPFAALKDLKILSKE
ncbi:MAG: hypothetical protein CO093_08850 [Alphaproteobacteria bacterium CG_4_9_14_3_um_filter_47_13]|nr:MAG: hypothetical protein CO093_08850 [Alphaproteobacteria bacterium CG_4_9_14_3_um_filter_47_13]